MTLVEPQAAAVSSRLSNGPCERGRGNGLTPLDAASRFGAAMRRAGSNSRNLGSPEFPTEAKRLALRDLGGLTQVTQAVRDVGTIWPDVLWRDVRHSLRSLQRTPAFTTVALTVPTLSIGATTAIFSVVDTVMFRRLPFPERDRLVAVGELNVKDSASSPLNLTPPQTFLDWRDQQDVFTDDPCLVTTKLRAAGRFRVGRFLFEVRPRDATVYAGALLVLVTTGLAAAFGPARRASSVDPLIALRMD